MPKQDLKVNDEVWVVDIDNYVVTKGQVTEVVTDMSRYEQIGAQGIEFTYEVTLPLTKIRFCYPKNYGYIRPKSSIQEAITLLTDNLDDHISWYQSRLNSLQATKQRLLDQLEAETNTSKQLELDLGV